SRLAAFKLKSIQQIELANNQTFQTMASAAKSFGDDFTDTMTDMVMGAEVTFGNILESFSRMLIQMAIKTQFVQPILGGLFGAAGGGSGGGLIGDLFGNVVSSGGVTTHSQLGKYTVSEGSGGAIFGLGKPMAEGGVATKPTAGIFGEAGAEALIPLDRFKDFQGGSNVQINIIGAPEGTKTQETTTEGGGRRVDVLLDEATADNIRPGTKTFQQMQKAFNVNNKLRRR
ncbi:MAG: hypothetical protein HOG49_19380, partial [Candidatus Scalindua sp.]|nr:hypothetical protein [Candidatus Scalindua sp.]